MTLSRRKLARVAAETEALEALPRDMLLERWRALIGRPPPKHLSLSLLRKAIAYELQVAAFGEPSVRVLKALERITAGNVGASAPVASTLKPGSRLLREWNGRSWQVEVLKDGYLMEGTRYRSLSAVAKAITGAHWSGPRFFGLTGRKITGDADSDPGTAITGPVAAAREGLGCRSAS